MRIKKICVVILVMALVFGMTFIGCGGGGGGGDEEGDGLTVTPELQGKWYRWSGSDYIVLGGVEQWIDITKNTMTGNGVFAVITKGAAYSSGNLLYYNGAQIATWSITSSILTLDITGSGGPQEFKQKPSQFNGTRWTSYLPPEGGGTTSGIAIIEFTSNTEGFTAKEWGGNGIIYPEYFTYTVSGNIITLIYGPGDENTVTISGNTIIMQLSPGEGGGYRTYTKETG